MKIGCYIIVKGDADKIESCIRSQQGLADVVMVAIDDGPDSLATRDVVANVTLKSDMQIRYYHQTWPNSYSTARNDALNFLLLSVNDLDYV